MERGNPTVSAVTPQGERSPKHGCGSHLSRATSTRRSRRYARAPADTPLERALSDLREQVLLAPTVGQQPHIMAATDLGDSPHTFRGVRLSDG